MKGRGIEGTDEIIPIEKLAGIRHRGSFVSKAVRIGRSGPKAAFSPFPRGHKPPSVNCWQPKLARPVERSPEDLREVGNYVAALEHGFSLLEELPLCVRLGRELNAKLNN